MKALVLDTKAGRLRLAERPEPILQTYDDVKLRVLRVGICGTDREEVSGARVLAVAGGNEIVIGHEMIGQVVEVGSSVRGINPGDLATLTVRRGCRQCAPCELGRPDMCRTGDFRERGIWGLDGYNAEFVVDTQKHVIVVPRALEHAGVLMEPLSVVEKAIQITGRMQQARLPDGLANPNWLFGRTCLVTGLGPIGLLAALVLTLRGAQVWGLDVVDRSSARPRWLEKIGSTYVDGRQTKPDELPGVVGRVDLIFEASGVPDLAFELIGVLAPDGALVLSGIPGGESPVNAAGAHTIRHLVLGNRIVVGAVNAATGHFQSGVVDLLAAQSLWGNLVDELITHHLRPADTPTALAERGESGEIKTVIDWT
jgi:threonine dehydrogenase-like Zn-dependent dehydrogenase